MKNKITLLVLLTSILVFGQQKQPKVGLVLSGGGAKGFAHIGILKELDRAGVQIDYIGGTSMGAIVGALYASGYSGVQIEKIVRENDFIYLLRDKLPRNTATFFEKEYGEKTKISFPVTKNGVGLPKGVSKGQSVLNLLNELLGCKDEFTDFSKLPIPFFCVATDVETGGAVTLENGSLPLALRSSGSFPTLLNPVTYGDKLLVDGGIANNFPITKMKEKGMDLIIGVDVEGRLFEKEKLTSVLAILNQIVSYQMYSKTELEKEKLDIYIHPKIFEHTVVDFKSKNQILEKGEKEALKFRKVFEEIAAKQTIKRKRKPIDFDYSKKLISKINIEGSTNNTRAFVLGKLRLKVGDSLTRKEITSSINLLSATKNYDRIEYKLEKLEDDTHQLNFILTETKDNASISIGAHYDFLYKSGILANYQQKHMLVNNDLFSLDVILGDNLRYNLNYFVDNGFYISYGFRSRYNHFRDNSKFNLGSFQFPNLSSINLNYTDFTNQFFVQTTFNRKFAVGLGIEHKLINATTETIITNGDRTVIDRSNYYSTYGYIKLDTYDKKYFVTKGFFADLNFKWYLFSSDFNNDFRKFAQAKGTLGFATTIWDKLTLQLTNEAGFTLNNPSSTIFDYYLGGYNQNYINNFVSLYGYAFSELSDHSFVKSEFNFRYKMSSKHYAVFIANYARINDNVFKDIDLFQDVISGYAVGYSYDSFLGPIEFKYSWTPDNKESHFLFNLGFWF